MKVILLERVGRMGTIGDEVTVKDGFARNFLLPQGKALRASEANRAKFEAERQTIEARNAERRSEAEKNAASLDGKTIVMVRQAGETGQLYGSVSARDIADALLADGEKIERNQVDLEGPIKTVGLHEVALNLHAEVAVKITVNVARSADEAERQAAGENLARKDYNDEEEEFVSLADMEDEDYEATQGEAAAAAEEIERQQDA
ncbi:50S ribosomal protein L9 [Pelagibacterium halotolerans]|uniref:Large ribosomal subunit protein bL9 n=1 Tax=Pelagibacterium halotolerans (strain DSM 22347 / JCM 15775 / CGMCC 1.7692 / B2) TaxID=1082931 RepID=G4RGI3_PELHB|nr:50S ribosomal protein L9 [Pelagibacterium halotolerans]AEQ51042.1 LSU ribosomal protein L9 [Pelagibacterium halotolerans B2]QJR19070.1 50S ribosomal protein L9 [Pelagibacterium halotolerans]SEA03263.1 LSU ribosomal protein L9P [Pelagibacterium halotolerans]